MIAILYKDKRAVVSDPFNPAVYHTAALLGWEQIRDTADEHGSDEASVDEQSIDVAHVLTHLRYQSRMTTSVPIAGDIIIAGDQAVQLLPFLDMRGSQRRLTAAEYGAAIEVVQRLTRPADPYTGGHPYVYLAEFACGHTSLIVASTLGYLSAYQVGQCQPCIECRTDVVLTAFRPANETEQHEAAAIEREAEQYRLKEARRNGR